MLCNANVQNAPMGWQTLRSSRLTTAGDVKCPTPTEMSRLEAWPILCSSRSACQSFRWCRTFGPRSPVSKKDKPNSSKFSESRENSCVFRPRAWAPFRTLFPKIPDVCHIGANRSEVVDVD